MGEEKKQRTWLVTMEQLQAVEIEVNASTEHGAERAARWLARLGQGKWIVTGLECTKVKEVDNG